MVHVIYDDLCGFCIRSLKVCRALDFDRRLSFHGSSSFRLQPTLGSRETGLARGREATGVPGLADADFDNAVFTVAPDHRVARGFFAFRCIARELPLMWPLLPLFYFPGSSIIGPRVYAWVASNRARLGCESGLCDVPQPGQQRH